MLFDRVPYYTVESFGVAPMHGFCEVSVSDFNICSIFILFCVANLGFIFYSLGYLLPVLIMNTFITPHRQKDRQKDRL